MNRQNVTKWCSEFSEEVRRRLWGARRSHDVLQNAGGRLLWLGDTKANSNT